MRTWFEQHHAKGGELWAGFRKRGSGRASVIWPESVDAALCFGWIDGIRKNLDSESYVIRFTPRKPRSIWSAVNIKRAGELAELGLMHEAGHKAFAARAEDRSAIYAYEQRKHPALEAGQERLFRKHAKAWAYFQKQPPSYRRTATWWVVSAKREETREKRLGILIADSAAEVWIGQLRR